MFHSLESSRNFFGATNTHKTIISESAAQTPNRGPSASTLEGGFESTTGKHYRSSEFMSVWATWIPTRHVNHGIVQPRHAKFGLTLSLVSLRSRTVTQRPKNQLKPIHQKSLNVGCYRAYRLNLDGGTRNRKLYAIGRSNVQRLPFFTWLKAGGGCWYQTWEVLDVSQCMILTRRIRAWLN